MAEPMPQVTIVILTLNEEADLPACMAALPAGWPVVVLDSGSTDRTAELAMAAGSVVARHPWAGFAGQRNHALALPAVQTPWVLFIDADERYGPEFYAWVQSQGLTDAVDGWLVPSRLILDGRPLNHAPGYPILHPRLVHKARARFQPNYAGHGEALDEACRTARAPLGYDHYFQSGDLTPWLIKHIGLAGDEASSAGRQTATTRARLSAMLPPGPLKALVRFLYHYLFRGGVLDGAAGFRYAAMYAWYEMTVWLIRRSRREPR